LKEVRRKHQQDYAKPCDSHFALFRPECKIQGSKWRKINIRYCHNNFKNWVYKLYKTNKATTNEVHCFLVCALIYKIFSCHIYDRWHCFFEFSIQLGSKVEHRETSPKKKDGFVRMHTQSLCLLLPHGSLNPFPTHSTQKVSNLPGCLWDNDMQMFQHKKMLMQCLSHTKLFL
jgi:hypothetical protein